MNTESTGHPMPSSGPLQSTPAQSPLWCLNGAVTHASGSGEVSRYLRITHPSGCVLLLERGVLNEVKHRLAALAIIDALNAAG